MRIEIFSLADNSLELLIVTSGDYETKDVSFLYYKIQFVTFLGILFTKLSFLNLFDYIDYKTLHF